MHEASLRTTDEGKEKRQGDRSARGGRGGGGAIDPRSKAEAASASPEPIAAECSGKAFPSHQGSQESRCHEVTYLQKAKRPPHQLRNLINRGSMRDPQGPCQDTEGIEAHNAGAERKGQAQ